MDNRLLKDFLYEQVARVGKALSSPKRLELLAQGEKAVETVAADVAIDLQLASAHLKALKAAHLVQSRRDGKRMLYRLGGDDVAQLGVRVRAVAEEHWVELTVALLRSRGYRACKTFDGVSEWRAAGLPVNRV